MAKLTFGQKAERVVKLLLGVRDPRIAAALSARGFAESDLQSGWEHLAALTRRCLGVPVPAEEPRWLDKLDDFENQWFPIARATLAHNYPALEQALFRNLAQTAGRKVIVSVGAFLDRIGQMAAGEAAFQGEGPAARALLARRGLTDNVVQEGQGIIRALQTVQPMDHRGDAVVELSPAEQRAAEDALWAWYLEWSTIARTSIRDKRLLRTIGFLKECNAKAPKDAANGGTSP